MTYSYYSRFCESCKIPAKSVSLCETCPLRSAVICEVDEQDAAPPGREEDGRRIGLSNVTYLTDISYEVRAYDGGSLIESRPVGFPKRKKGGGMRGKITKFTRAARKRMMKKLATFRREELAKALFITLTYPAEYPDGKRAKRDLDRFLKRLRNLSRSRFARLPSGYSAGYVSVIKSAFANSSRLKVASFFIIRFLAARVNLVIFPRIPPPFFRFGNPTGRLSINDPPS